MNSHKCGGKCNGGVKCYGNSACDKATNQGFALGLLASNPQAYNDLIARGLIKHPRA